MTQVLEFAMKLVDETRTSDELEIILNYDPEGEPYRKGQFMHLNRLKDAVDNNQKQVSGWRLCVKEGERERVNERENEVDRKSGIVYCLFIIAFEEPTKYHESVDTSLY